MEKCTDISFCSAGRRAVVLKINFVFMTLLFFFFSFFPVPKLKALNSEAITQL